MSCGEVCPCQHPKKYEPESEEAIRLSDKPSSRSEDEAPRLNDCQSLDRDNESSQHRRCADLRDLGQDEHREVDKISCLQSADAENQKLHSTAQRDTLLIASYSFRSTIDIRASEKE